MKTPLDRLYQTGVENQYKQTKTGNLVRFYQIFMISVVLYKADRKHIRCICAQDMVQWVNVEYDMQSMIYAG